MPTPKLTPEIIAAAVEGYEAQKIRIDGKIAELRALLPGGSPEAAAAPEAPVGKRKVSAAARRRMAIAQKKRWAAIKGKVAEPTALKGSSKPKRRISKEGMARIVAATKKRWAAVRAANARRQNAASKRTAKRKAVKKAAKSTGPDAAQVAKPNILINEKK